MQAGIHRSKRCDTGGIRLDVISLGMIAFLATSFFIYFFRSRAATLGLVDRPSNRKRHEADVPVIGGIAILAGFLLTYFSTTGLTAEMQWFIVTALLLTGVGVVDDVASLSHKTRLLVQAIAGLLMVMYGGLVLHDLGALFIRDVVLTLGPLSVPFTIICVVGLVNAYNMCDGIDGLAGVLALVALLGLSVVAFMGGQTETFTILIIVCACVIAFLAFNARSPWRKKAVIFLGDAGSSLLGFIIVWFSIALSQGDTEAMTPVTALWFVALPLFELVGTTFRRLMSSKSPFIADREHLHHLFLSAGFSVTQTLFSLAATASVFACIGISGLYLRVHENYMLLLFLGSFFLYYYFMIRAWRSMRFLGRNVCRRLHRHDRRQMNTRRLSLHSSDERAYEGANRREIADRRVHYRRAKCDDPDSVMSGSCDAVASFSVVEGVPKVIFVNRFFWPDVSATSQLLSDLAFSIAASGRPVVVVTSRQRYDDASAELPVNEEVNKVSIRRVWTSQYGRQRLYGRAIDYLTFYSSTLWRLLCTVKKGDVVVAMTDPPLILILAALVTLLKRAKLVNWHQDVFPEIASSLGVKGMRGRGARVVKSLRNSAISAAAANVVLSRRMAQVLAVEGVDVANLTIISNWSDGHEVYPTRADENPLRKQWNLQNKFVIGYSGNMGRVHEFAAIIDAAERLQHDTDIVFLFIGGGFYRQQIEDEAEKRGLRNIFFRPYQPRECLLDSLGVPDVHLVSLRPDMEGLVFPSKLYGIMAAGRPTLFVGAENGDVAQILRNEHCGIAVNSGDVDGIVDAIRHFRNDATHRREMGDRGHALFERHYEMNAALASWCKVLSPLLTQELPYVEYRAHNRQDI